MNRQDLINDLLFLQSQHQKILGAIEYVSNKIKDIERLEKEAKIKEANSKKTEAKLEEEKKED